MNTFPCQGRRGFSLIELLCAILILGVGLVGLTQGITTALTSSKESEVQTAAALIAAGCIETLRADGIILAGEEESEEGAVPAPYRWKQSITRTSIDGLFNVKVVVENSRTGKGIYELETLLFDPPLLSSTSSSSSSGSSSAEARRKERRNQR